MQDFKEILINPAVCAGGTKKVSVPKKNNVTGETYNVPFTVRAITAEEKDKAFNKALKDSQANNGEFKESLIAEQICLTAILEPSLKDQKFINDANKRATDYNTKLRDQVEKEFEEANKAYQEGISKGQKMEKPQKRKAVYFNPVNTSLELLRYILNAGEIHQLSEKILDLSGFNSRITDYMDEAKN